MSNPMSEIRTDNSGNVITRWIRSMNKKLHRTAIPSPVIEDDEEEYAKPVPSHEPEIIELFGVLHPKNEYDPNGSLANKIRIIADADLTLIQRITEAARNSPNEREYWLDKFHLSKNLGVIHSMGAGYFINHEPRQLELALQEFRIALTVNEVLRTVGHNCLAPIGLDPIKEIHLLYPDAVTLVMEIMNVKNPLEDFTKAITMIVYVRGDEDPNARFPLDWYAAMHRTVSTDAAYIAGRIEQVTELLPELHARKTYDRTVIDMLLTHEAQALREGEL